MNYLALLRLREIIATRSSNIIEKGKKYVKVGQKPPKGVTLHKGPRGGMYYLVEDKRMKIGGKHHELIRGRGVTKDQWDEVRQKHLGEGAESVEFIPQPGYGGKAGKKLYNIYVRGKDTDEKIESKVKADKEKYGKRKIKDMNSPEPPKEPEWEIGDTYTNRSHAWDEEKIYQNKGYKTKLIEGKNEKGRKTYQVQYQKPAPATTVKDRLLQIGGRYWKSDDGSKERVYIEGNTFSEMIGLKTEQYNTGNISSATLKGEPISNSKAKKILGYFGLNTYYDLNENTFKGFNPDYIDELEEYIKPLEKHTPTKTETTPKPKSTISAGWMKEIAEGETPTGKDTNRHDFQKRAVDIHESLMLHKYKKGEIPAEFHIKPGYDQGKIRVYESFPIKDKLKSGKYSWDPYTKTWEKSVSLSDIQFESKFLSEAGATSFRFDNAPDVRNYIIQELKPEGGSWGKFYDKYQEQAMDKLNEHIESVKKKFGLFF